MTNDFQGLKQYLSPYHKYFYSRTCLGYSTNVYVAVQYNKLPNLADLYKALEHLVVKNPPLGLQIFSEGNFDVNAKQYKTESGIVSPDPPSDVYYAQLNEIDFVKTVRVEDTLDIKDDAALEIFLSEGFEYGRHDKPLWEIVIMKDNWIVFLFDHTLLDGMSGANAHKDIISYLNNHPSVSITDEQSFTFHPQKFLSTTEFGITDVYKSQNSNLMFIISKVLPTLFKPFLSKFLNYIVHKFSLNPSTLGSLYRFRCDPKKYIVQKGKFIDNHLEINIPQVDTLRLIKLGKKHGNISMNTLLCSLFAVATKNNLVVEEQAVNVSVPVNSRSITNTEPRKISLVVKGLELITPVLKHNLLDSDSLNIEEFWKFASLAQEQLSKGIPSKAGLDNVSMLGMIDLLSFIKAKEHCPPTDTFEVSNLGLQFNEKEFSDAHTSEYVIKNAVFNQCLGISNCFTVSSMATLCSGTNLEIMYPNELKKESTGVINSFQKYLDQLLNLIES